MLSHVSIVCFASSYAVALLVEMLRLMFRVPIRLLVTAGFTAAGLFAQTVYLVMRSNPDPQRAPPLSSWFDWLLLIAWGMVVVYLVEIVRRPQANLGIFMLPLVLLLIGVAWLFRNAAPFRRGETLYWWGMIHGAALLAGAVVVMLGFVAGVMYLVQSYRLKRKLPPRPGFRLPSLERLQNANRRSLLISSALLFAGLISGVVLKLVGHTTHFPWTDPIIGTSALLLAWLIAVVLFESLYKPAQQGRKVAYLTLASFIVLGLVLTMVLLGPSQHAVSERAAEEGHLPGAVVVCHSLVLHAVSGRDEGRSDGRGDGCEHCLECQAATHRRSSSGVVGWVEARRGPPTMLGPSGDPR